MDIKLAQEIIATKTLEQVTSYLASQKFDRDISKMGLMELSDYMAHQPELPHQAEYILAQRVLKNNADKGSLSGIDCQVCKNKGVTYHLGDDGYEVCRECACMTKRRCIRNAENSGMGDLLTRTTGSYTVSEPWQRTLLNGAEYYMSSNCGEWYCMMGQSGAGKTHLCSAVANHFLHSGKKVVYMIWNTAVKELKQNATDSVPYNRLFNRYALADVLYVDDLFKGKITDADIAIAFDIINRRYNRMDAITIISTELYMQDLLKMDAALAGRIKERCGRYVVEIKPDANKNYRFKDVSCV